MNKLLLLVCIILLSGCDTKEISSKSIDLANETCKNNDGLEKIYPESFFKYGLIVCKNSAIFTFSEDGGIVKTFVR